MAIPWSDRYMDYCALYYAGLFVFDHFLDQMRARSWIN